MCAGQSAKGRFLKREVVTLNEEMPVNGEKSKYVEASFEWQMKRW